MKNKVKNGEKVEGKSGEIGRVKIGCEIRV